MFSQLWFSQAKHTNPDEGIVEFPLKFFDFRWDAALWRTNTINPEIIARAYPPTGTRVGQRETPLALPLVALRPAKATALSGRVTSISSRLPIFQAATTGWRCAY